MKDLSIIIQLADLNFKATDPSVFDNFNWNMFENGERVYVEELGFDGDGRFISIKEGVVTLSFIPQNEFCARTFFENTLFVKTQNEKTEGGGKPKFHLSLYPK